MIEISNLVKKYDKFTAVDNINLCARDSEITILLGPNGAGKSTTIKSICGLLTYQGDIRVCGADCRSIDAKKVFAYAPEVPALYDLLTVEEHIEFIAHAYNLDYDYKSYGDVLLNKFNLMDKKNKIAKELSKGMCQKLSLILALIIKPKALLVDEPMIGLDPQAIEDVLHILVELKNQGVSVLISTHIIDIIEDIWDKAYIMNKSHIVTEVRREDLKDTTLKEVYFDAIGGGDEVEYNNMPN